MVRNRQPQSGAVGELGHVVRMAQGLTCMHAQGDGKQCPLLPLWHVGASRTECDEQGGRVKPRAATQVAAGRIGAAYVGRMCTAREGLQ